MSESNLTLLEHHHQLINAVAMNESIPRQVKALLVGIATFFNVKNQCAFPSRRQISDRTGYCINHVTDLIKEATQRGLIKSTPQYMQVEGEAAPRQIANKYEFVLSKFGLFYSALKVKIAKEKRNKSKKHPTKTPQSVPGQENPTEHIASNGFDVDAMMRNMRHLKNCPSKPPK